MTCSFADQLASVRQMACEASSDLPRRAREDLEAVLADYDATRNEVASVLMLMDGLAEQWGDEGVFRRCRDRLRKLVGEKT